MNKIIIGVVVLVAVAIGWFILNPGDTLDYVVTIDQEVAVLEVEFAELNAQIAAGTLTPEQATAAKIRIITTLDAINASASASESIQLTPAQREQLANGLIRLKDALISYHATLNAVDDLAVTADVNTQLQKGNGRSSQHLSLIMADTIDSYEQTVTDSVQDYEPDLQQDGQIDAVVEEVEAAELMKEEMRTVEELTADQAADTAVDGALVIPDSDAAEETPAVSDEPEAEDTTGDEEITDPDLEVSNEVIIQVVQ